MNDRDEENGDAYFKPDDSEGEEDDNEEAEENEDDGGSSKKRKKKGISFLYFDLDAYLIHKAMALGDQA